MQIFDFLLLMCNGILTCTSFVWSTLRTKYGDVFVSPDWQTLYACREACTRNLYAKPKCKRKWFSRVTLRK